jgi:hypothetical protein
MPDTNSIYEEPSRLSQGLVIGLSIAVVMMAGWLVVTIRAQSPTTAREADAATNPPAIEPPEERAVSSAADQPRQRSTSVHFDWPEEFASAPDSPPPPRTALPLAPELPVARDFGHPAWPAAGVAPSTASRQPVGADATDAIVETLVPQPLHGGARKNPASPSPAPRQAQRQQKPRVETDASQQ